MNKKKTLVKWFDEVWSKENTSFIKEMFVSEKGGSTTGINKHKGISPDEFIAFQAQLLGLLMNIRLTVDDFIEEVFPTFIPNPRYNVLVTNGSPSQAGKSYLSTEASETPIIPIIIGSGRRRICPP